MKAIKLILIAQLVIGLLGVFLSVGRIVSASYQKAWAVGFKVKLQEVQRSAEYHEPPKVLGLSYSEVAEHINLVASNNAKGPVEEFLFCGVISLLSVTGLWLLHRAGAQPTSTPHEKVAA